MNFKQSFIFELYKKAKLLFYGTIIYLVVCVITILQSFQITPFYNWSMYSKSSTQPKTFGITEIYCDDVLLSQPHTFNDFSRLMINYTTREYLKLKDSSTVIPTYQRVSKTLTKFGLNGDHAAKQLTIKKTDIAAYPAWLKKYVKANLVQNFDSLKLYYVTVSYDDAMKMNVIDKQLVFTQ